MLFNLILKLNACKWVHPKTESSLVLLKTIGLLGCGQGCTGLSVIYLEHSVFFLFLVVFQSLKVFS